MRQHELDTLAAAQLDDDVPDGYVRVPVEVIRAIEEALAWRAPSAEARKARLREAMHAVLRAADRGSAMEIVASSLSSRLVRRCGTATGIAAADRDALARDASGQGAARADPGLDVELTTTNTTA